MSGLDTLFEEALENYRNKNADANPSRIIVFKSALESKVNVSVEEVKQFEITAISKALASIKLVVVLVLNNSNIVVIIVIIVIIVLVVI